jgi:Tfp pilus assembly protein PilV
MQKVVNKEHGFCLLEVLLAWCVIVAVALSVFSLQWMSVRHLKDYALHEDAIIGVNNLAEQLLVTKSEMSRQQVFSAWKKQVLSQFPQSKAEMNCGNGDCHIVLSWYRSEYYDYALDVWL